MKRTQNSEQIRLEDKVKLKENTEYSAMPSNPKIGSKYECDGVVEEIDIHDKRKDPHCVGVRWKNGEYNTYRYSDLTVIEAGFISIWDNVATS
jgi:hypothetical protein